MKADKVWNDRMPKDRLTEVLPDNSSLGDAIAPPAATQTGLTTGWTVASGHEPYLYDGNTFKLLAELGAGATSGFLSSVASYQGDLFITGYTYDNATSEYHAVVGRYDPETGSLTRIVDLSGGPNDWANAVRIVGDDVFFLLHNDTAGTHQLGTIDPSTNSVSFVPFPEAWGAVRAEVMDSHNGLLIIQNSYSFDDTQPDILIYDPAAATWSGYTLPVSARVAYVSNPTAVGVGNYYFFFGHTGYTTNLYKLDVTSGALTIAYPDVSSAAWEYEGTSFGSIPNIGGDMYLTVYNATSSGYTILEIDSTGTVSKVPGVDNLAAWILASDDTTAYYASIDWTTDASGATFDVLQLSHDADGNTVTRLFDLNASHMRVGVLMDGYLYVGQRGSDGDSDLYRLNVTTGAWEQVSEFGTSTEWEGVVALGAVDGHLAVAADTDANGSLELWTSTSPSDPTSWMMISGDVSIRPGNFDMVLDGDYLL